MGGLHTHLLLQSGNLVHFGEIASKLHDPIEHIVWEKRRIRQQEVERAAMASDYVLHFGATDRWTHYSERRPPSPAAASTTAASTASSADDDWEEREDLVRKILAIDPAVDALFVAQAGFADARDAAPPTPTPLRPSAPSTPHESTLGDGP